MKKAGQKTAVASSRYMFVNLIYIMVVLSALPFTSILGAPAAPVKSNPIEENLRQIRTMLNDIKHELNNHDTEIKTFDNRLQNQENLLESIRQQLTDNQQNQQEIANAQRVNVESKVDSLDNLVQGLISDMRQLKVQANDSVSILSQYKQKLADLEKIITAQSQHMKSLETGLQSLIEVIQAKDAIDKAMSRGSINSSKTYKVQPGDSLEKIARNHKVSIQSLRELNNISQDRIIVGQTIKIP